MTGFGKAVTNFANKKITVEIKSLNSKQLDLQVKLPHAFRAKELDLRNIVAQKLERGKVDLYISCETISTADQASINISAAQQYKKQIEELSAALNIPMPTDWHTLLLKMPDVLKAHSETDTDDDEAEIQALFAAVRQAVDALMDFRRQEGEKLKRFFEEKIEAIGNLLKEVEPYENERIVKIKERIEENLINLKNIEFDRNRFEQEMIFYIEKLDINEEKLRLRNHLAYFLETMENGHGQGKKLGFISQELGREINTLGSKSNHAEMQNIVVRMKDQLEQIKEQVLNVM